MNYNKFTELLIRYFMMRDYQSPIITQLHSSRARCQTWTSEISQHLISPNIHQTIKRSTSAGTVRKPWR
ncbi:myb-like protein P [Vespula maculifrons]|uniref:Myb-like protein P n=1 Tax=Vespula maculifrons TaxID=7453 RepID=A0ABD2D2U5_VESMC